MNHLAKAKLAASVREQWLLLRDTYDLLDLEPHFIGMSALLLRVGDTKDAEELSEALKVLQRYTPTELRAALSFLPIESEEGAMLLSYIRGLDSSIPLDAETWLNASEPRPIMKELIPRYRIWLGSTPVIEAWLELLATFPDICDA